MKTNKPTNSELIFYNRAIERMLTFSLVNVNRSQHIISTFEQFYGKNSRYETLARLFNERVNYLTPNPGINRVKEITQDEWECAMKDSVINQLEWEDIN